MFKVYAELSSIIHSLTLSVVSWLELNGQYILCTALLLCVLVRPTYNYTLSFSGLPDALVPIFPVQMRGEIPSMLGLPFNRH
jgi:hypothetical protein